MIDHLWAEQHGTCAAAVLLWLSTRCDDDGVVTASASTIAKATTHGRNQVRPALAVLIRHGEVDVIEPPKGRRPGTYRVVNRITFGPQKPAEPLNPARSAAPAPVVAPVRAAIATPAAQVRSMFKATVSTQADFLAWCRAAKPGTVLIWHIGMIAIDRTTSSELNAIAQAVSLFADGGYIVQGQHSVQLPAGRQIAYTAMRASDGWAPRSVLTGKLTAHQYLALRAVQTRPAAVSAARAIRAGLGVSDDAAERILGDLARAGWIKPEGYKSSWVLADDAREMVL